MECACQSYLQKDRNTPVFPKAAKTRKGQSEGYDTVLYNMHSSRPVLEYACPVFHNALPQYLSNNLERLEKRALRIIYSDLSYAEALVAAGITYCMREDRC